MTKYTDRNNENPLSGIVIKTLILEGDFLTAWYIVCIYILQMDITDFHKQMMKQRYNNDKTLIMAGRGLGKSFLLTTAYVLTLILRDRNIAIAVITRTQSQSKSFVSELKDKMEKGGIIYDIFGDLKGGEWTKTQFTLKREANRLESTVTACSVNAPNSIVSKHYDILLLDDIVSLEASSTRYMRDQTDDTLHNDIMPAMHPLSEYQYMHVVGTHYHPDDTYSRLESRGGFSTLKIPSIIEKEEGKLECIWENIPEKTYERILYMRDTNPLAYEQQYQQIIRKGDGEIFKGEWISYFHEYSIEGGNTFIHIKDDEGIIEKVKVDLYAGVDLAISKKETADYFVFAVIGVDDKHNVYVLDFNRGRYTFQKQKQIIKEMANKWGSIQRIGIETVAYQQALFGEMKDSTSLPLVSMKTSTDKISRLNVFGAMFENQKVFFFSHLKDLDIMVNEFLEFPGAKHDDIPDAVCMAWEISKENKAKGNIITAGPDLSEYGFVF